MSVSIPVSDFDGVRRYVDRSLSESGAAEFRVLPHELDDVTLALAFEGLRYAAWRARMMSGCHVVVRRSICSCHGFFAYVEMTTRKADFPPDEAFPG